MFETRPTAMSPGQLPQELLDEGGLAGAYFTADDGEAGVIDDAVFQHGERHAVRAAPSTKTRGRAAAKKASL